jgi:hypothetical protein
VHLTADQFRAARAMLRMDQFAIQGALEKAGVEFTNGNQPSVRRKSSGGSIPVEELNASNDD